MPLASFFIFETNMADKDKDEEQQKPEEIMANFVSLAAEGELLAQKGNYAEAIDFYTRALLYKPSDKVRIFMHSWVALPCCEVSMSSSRWVARVGFTRCQ
jgi:tetratricopeptide (TPR) repeat protein